MKKKLLSAISLMMVSAMAFTGCGGTDTPTNQTTAPADATTGAEGEKTTKAENTSKGGGTVYYYTMWNETEPQGQVISEAAEAFEEKTGTKVEITWAGRDTRKTLEPAISSGTDIDLFDEDVERVNQNWGKFLMDLEDLASKTYDGTDGKPYTEVINQTLVDLARSLGEGGTLHTIPYQPSAFVTMYNKAIFTQAGIDGVPKTWDEFLDACEKIKQAGKTPITVDDAYMGCLIGYTLGRTIGKDAAIELSQDKTKWDAALPAAQKWQEMYEKGYISPKAGANIYPAGQQEIASGEVAMYLNGTWLPNEIKNSVAPDFEWGSFAFPAIAPEGDGIEANNFGSQCFGINKDAKNPEGAFEFIVFLTTGTYDIKLSEESLGIPMANNSEWPSQLADAKVIVDSTTTRYPWGLGMESDADIHTRIKENFARLITGGIDAQGFVDAMKQ